MPPHVETVPYLGCTYTLDEYLEYDVNINALVPKPSPKLGIFKYLKENDIQYHLIALYKMLFSSALCYCAAELLLSCGRPSYARKTPLSQKQSRELTPFFGKKTSHTFLFSKYFSLSKKIFKNIFPFQ